MQANFKSRTLADYEKLSHAVTAGEADLAALLFGGALDALAGDSRA